MTTTSKGSVIRRKSLATEVADKLREKILRGELREGEQLRQEAIAAEFQMSQIPVREALRRLEAEGLVTINLYRGAVVSALPSDEIEDLFEIRAVLESTILRRAIPHLTEEDLQQAESILDAYERALTDPSDTDRWSELHWQFHSTLYAAAKRARFMSLIQTINMNADRYIRLHIRFSRDLHHQVKNEHRRILEHCRARDVKAATELLERHIRNAGHEMKEFIERFRQES
jgi:DNA-binding GntR family transcriptional regulator